MDKSDKIILWCGLILVLQTIPTWFIIGWYWFDISVATIIATLVLCISFLARAWFIEYLFIYIYYIKLTNIISHIANYGKSEFPTNTLLIIQIDLLNGSKPILNVILYIWFAYAFIKYVKGWEYHN